MAHSPDDPGMSPDEFMDGHIEEMEVEEPRRAASMVFRSEDEANANRVDSLEAANQSLADALRIVYRLLQVVMVGLGLLFCFSGFQQVNEGETGIKVALGEITDADLNPGFQFSLPYPLGEIIKIDQGQTTLTMDNQFWPSLTDRERTASLDDLTLAKRTLKPDIDGSLITGDGSIVHVQWTMTYHREDPADFMSNLAEGQEERLLRSALQRATIHIVSQLTIDEILKPKAQASDGSTASGRFEGRVRRLAQDYLDEHGSGIQIDSLALHNATPPLSTRAEFNKLTEQGATRGRRREEATKQATIDLNETAGTASRPLLALLDRFEELADQGRESEAEQTLEIIFDVLDGEYDGETLTVGDQTFSDFSLAGDAGKMISNARVYRDTVVTDAKASAAMFDSKLKQYEASPRVFVVREFTDAFVTMVNSGVVQQYVLPQGSDDVRFWISPDPEIMRSVEEAMNSRENTQMIQNYLERTYGEAEQSEMDVLLDMENKNR